MHLKRQLTDNPGGPGGPVGPGGPPTPYYQEIKIMFPLRPSLINVIHDKQFINSSFINT